MGAGATKKQGAPANPRLVYNQKLEKKEKKNLMIDTPVLMDVEHGSIRYRYGQKDGEPASKSRRKEKPFEGEEDKSMKKDYFYHARLKDFSEKGTAEKEDDFKFMYVAKGPASAKNKKVFYVYGKGFQAIDGKIVKPTENQEEGQDKTWPQRKLPNDVYYNITFSSEKVVLPVKENTETETVDQTLGENESETKTSTEGESADNPQNQTTNTAKVNQSEAEKENQSGNKPKETEQEEELERELDITISLDYKYIKVAMKNDETAYDVRRFISPSIFKSKDYIHICYDKIEIKNNSVIANLREGNTDEYFYIELRLM